MKSRERFYAIITRFSRTSILTHTLHSRAKSIAAVALAIFILLLTLVFGRASHADGVCGDAAVDSPEQCDDGNLVNGDGCDSLCKTESCGNGTKDLFEQCDDGDALDGNGCSQYCQIEFCGDKKVQGGIGEQCDDGNGISGDGCTAACKLEAQELPAQQKKFSSSSSSEENTAPSEPESSHESATESQTNNADTTAASVTQSAAEAALAAETLASAKTTPAQAVIAARFLISPASEELRRYIDTEEQSQLSQILDTLSRGEKLTDQERTWAAELATQLAEARAAERAKYTDLLKQFISTPLSSDVVFEKNLDSANLVDVSVPMAIQELQQAVEIIQRGELRQQVQSDAVRLQRFGIDLGENLPADYASMLGKDSRPIDAFATLKTLKESAEAQATPDLPASLQHIGSEAETLRDSLAVLARAYGLNEQEARKMLSEIIELSQEVTVQDVDRLVSAVTRFMNMLERKDVPSAAGSETLHAAAAAQRIANEAGDPVPQTDVRSFVVAMAAKVPDKYKEVFETGSVEEQRAALLEFLQSDERIVALLKLLRDDGNTEFESRLQTLRKEIARVGSVKDTDTVCDDSMSDALQCTTQYLSDLQDAVRGRNLFTKIVGRLQDFFYVNQ